METSKARQVASRIFTKSKGIFSKLSKTGIGQGITSGIAKVGRLGSFVVRHAKPIAIVTLGSIAVYNTGTMVNGIVSSFGTSPHYYCDEYSKAMNFSLWSKYCEDSLLMIDGDGNLDIAYAAAVLIANKSQVLGEGRTDNYGGTDLYKEVSKGCGCNGSLSQCSNFVQTVIRWAGVDDEFPNNLGGSGAGSTAYSRWTSGSISTSQCVRLSKSDKWAEIDHLGDLTKLLPGDIIVHISDTAGHIQVYVGEDIMSAVHTILYDNNGNITTGYDTAHASYAPGDGYGGVPTKAWITDATTTSNGITYKEYRVFRCIDPDNSSKYTNVAGGGGFPRGGKTTSNLQYVLSANAVQKFNKAGIKSSYIDVFLKSYMAAVSNNDYGKGTPKKLSGTLTSFTFGAFNLSNMDVAEFLHYLKLTDSDKELLKSRLPSNLTLINSFDWKLPFITRAIFGKASDDDMDIFKLYLVTSGSLTAQVDTLADKINKITMPSSTDNIYKVCLYYYLYCSVGETYANNTLERVRFAKNIDELKQLVTADESTLKFLELLEANIK